MRLLLVLSLLLVGCSSSSVTDRTQVIVSVAASLGPAFAEVEEMVEDANPALDVVVNSAASSALREQILDGAAVDVYASADLANMATVVEAGAVRGEPTVFARNSLVIATPPGNPAGVSGLEDFADGSLFIGLCAADAPCGVFAGQVLANAGVVPQPDTLEPDVRALLVKIEAGELDAGIVYRTDVGAAGTSVVGLDIPAEVNVVAEYPIAVLTDAPNPSGADVVVEFVLSPEGRAILGEYGFELP